MHLAARLACIEPLACCWEPVYIRHLPLVVNTRRKYFIGDLTITRRVAQKVDSIVFHSTTRMDVGTGWHLYLGFPCSMINVPTKSKARLVIGKVIA